MVYGQQKINGYWQYFDPETGAQAKNKYIWLADQNKEVFYDGNGNMVYGWQKNLLNNHATQYFDPVTGAQYKSGKYTIDGKQYTFDNYGNLVDGNNGFAVRQTDTTAGQSSGSSSSLPNPTVNSNSSNVKSYVWNNNVNFVVESVDKDGNITLNVVGTYHDSQTKSSDFVEEQNTVYQNAIKHLPNGYKVEGAQALDAGTQSSVANGVKTTTANWNITVDPINSKPNTDNKPAPNGSTSANKPATSDTSHSNQPANNPNDVNHDVNGNSSSSTSTKPAEKPTGSANTNTSSSSSNSVKPSSEALSHSVQPANNPNDVGHDANGSDTTTNNKNNVPVVNPSAGNIDEDKPVQKPNGTTAKNPDDITPGSIEPGRPATDEDHSDANNSSSSNTESASETGSTNADNQNNSANSSSTNSTDSVNASVSNGDEPTTTTTSSDSVSTSNKQIQETNSSNDSTTRTSKAASQLQQVAEKQTMSDVGSNSATAGNTQSQTQSAVETAYKPVNRPMTQTEQMVVDADNGNNIQTANNSEQGQNTNAKTMPQTGESDSQAMAEVGLSMLGMIAATGIAINKKRFN